MHRSGLSLVAVPRTTADSQPLRIQTRRNTNQSQSYWLRQKAPASTSSVFAQDAHTVSTFDIPRRQQRCQYLGLISGELVDEAPQVTLSCTSQGLPSFGTDPLLIFHVLWTWVRLILSAGPCARPLFRPLRPCRTGTSVFVGLTRRPVPWSLVVSICCQSRGISHPWILNVLFSSLLARSRYRAASQSTSRSLSRLESAPAVLFSFLTKRP